MRFEWRTSLCAADFPAAAYEALRQRVTDHTPFNHLGWLCAAEQTLGERERLHILLGWDATLYKNLPSTSNKIIKLEEAIDLINEAHTEIPPVNSVPIQRLFWSPDTKIPEPLWSTLYMSAHEVSRIIDHQSYDYKMKAKYTFNKQYHSMGMNTQYSEGAIQLSNKHKVVELSSSVTIEKTSLITFRLPIGAFIKFIENIQPILTKKLHPRRNDWHHQNVDKIFYSEYLVNASYSVKIICALNDKRERMVTFSFSYAPTDEFLDSTEISIPWIHLGDFYKMSKRFIEELCPDTLQNLQTRH